MRLLLCILITVNTIGFEALLSEGKSIKGIWNKLSYFAMFALLYWVSFKFQ